MSEYDAINTMRTLPAEQRYIIEFDGRMEQFSGKDADEWFWSCMDTIKRMIEEWHIQRPPRFVVIMVRRELEDKGPIPWLCVKRFKMTHERPWIDLDEFEQGREFLYAIGQALSLAWRNRDAAAIVDHFRPKEKTNE